MNEGAIGVFDSGIGGLTVVAELKKRLPGERIIYLGDTARLPYGTKSPVTIRHYSKQNTDFLLNLGVKMLVIACNTASAWSIDQLRAFSPVSVLGVIEPGCKRAVDVSKSGRIGVIGTNATIRSEAYPTGIRRLWPEAHIISKPCPLFVPLVEEGWLDHLITYQVIEEYLKDLIEADIDCLVLGCTHYPMLKPAINRFCGDGIALICSAESVTDEVEATLKNLELNRNSLPEKDRFFLTDYSITFQKIMTLFLGGEVKTVEHIDINSSGHD